jgi:hypothetical protein
MVPVRPGGTIVVGGCDPTLLVMEEADLCIRFHRLGRTRLVNRVVITSDRRVAAWGALGARLSVVRRSATIAALTAACGLSRGG